MGEAWLKTRGVCLPSPDPHWHLHLPRQGCATGAPTPGQASRTPHCSPGEGVEALADAVTGS